MEADNLWSIKFRPMDRRTFFFRRQSHICYGHFLFKFTPDSHRFWG